MISVFLHGKSNTWGIYREYVLFFGGPFSTSMFSGTIILDSFDHDLRSVTGRGSLEGIHPMALVNHVFIQPDNDDHVPSGQLTKLWKITIFNG